MTNADLIIIVIMCNGPWAVMIHGVPVKTYNARAKSHYCTIIFIFSKPVHPSFLVLVFLCDVSG